VVDDERVEGEEVWVAETWKAHGYDHDVLGVYGSREAAFEALKAEPNMTVWVDEAGAVHGRPIREPAFSWPPRHAFMPVKWAQAMPMRVQDRKAATPELSEPRTTDAGTSPTTGN
jgi:hypothetical protein